MVYIYICVCVCTTYEKLSMHKHNWVSQSRNSQAQKSTTVLWLDLKNAYVPIPHKLVQLTLKHYHVPDRISNLILDYYKTFKMRTITEGSISAWWEIGSKWLNSYCNGRVLLPGFVQNSMQYPWCSSHLASFFY